MSARGIDNLTVMSDRDVVERASKTKNGDKFTKLYNGEAVLGNEEKDERSLMTRLAMFCGGDKDKLLRIFKSSGQFRDEKPNSFYELMAGDSLQFILQTKAGFTPKPQKNGEGKGMSFGANAKS